MSFDSIVKSGIARAVTLMASDGLQYRQGPSGSWATLVGKFHAENVQVVGYDEAHQAITAPASAHVKVPDGGTQLLVKGPGEEWQVRQSDGTEWAVVGVARHLGQTVYALSRVVPTSFGMARGDIP